MKKILIVDDEPDVIDLVRNRLEANNYEVISAKDGHDGIKKAQQQNPDLIVMDIMMPNMTGGDAVKILQSDENTKNIPVIFLTAVSEGLENSRINVDKKFYATIGKPFKPEELLTRVQKALGG